MREGSLDRLHRRDERAGSGQGNLPEPGPELSRLATSLGIGGTPTILGPDGTQIPTQLAQSPDQLAAELDRLAQVAVAKN